MEKNSINKIIQKSFYKGWSKFIKLGRAKATFIVTMSAMLTGILSIHFVYFLADQPIDKWVIISSVLTTLAFAPLVTWVFMGLLFKIHLLEKKQRRLATYDTLTGAFVRRVFFERCDALLKLVSREKSSLCIAFIDLDDFKKINDRYGHAGGDAVLKACVSYVTSCLRESDLIGRVGGEEFLVALPHTKTEAAVRLLNMVRSGIKKGKVYFNGEEIAYTISVGVVEFNLKNKKKFDELSKQADAALYQAKSLGKDRVIVYKEGEF